MILKYNHTFFVSSSTSSGAFAKSSNGAQFAIQHSPPIEIPINAKNIEVNVPTASIWNSTLNISAALANNTMYFTNDLGVEQKYTITIPDGRYSVSSLNTAINRLATAGTILAKDKFSLTGDESTQKCVFTISEAGWQIKFPASGSLGSILGFNAQKLPASALTTTAVYLTGDVVANFGSLTAFLISSSLASGSLTNVNGVASTGIYRGPITVAPGSLNSYAPYQPLKISNSKLAGQSIGLVNYALSDQNGVTLDTNGEDYSFTLVISYEIDG